MFRKAYALAALIAVAGLMHPARAAEFCVTCAGPDATYRCIIPELGAAAAEDPGARLACIKEMAAAGGHASCSVRRAAAGPCQGPIATLALPPPAVVNEAPAEEPRPVPAPVAPLPAGAHPPAEPVPPPGGTTVIEKTSDPTREPVPPVKTNLDKAGDAVSKVAKSAGRQIEKAGEAVGGAAKKTWDCMSSMFKDC
jgi:hypothetical protein